MKLWSGVLSPFSAKVRIALAEKGIDYTTLEIPWTRKNLWGPKPDAFLEVSPHGKVPALVDGEISLFDSTVILEYLEDTHPSPALYPSDAGGKARCRQLEDDADMALAGPVTVLVQEVFNKTDGGAPDSERVEEAVAELASHYGRWSAALGRAEYLCASFSVADIAAFLAAGFAATLGAPIPEAEPELQAWFGRMMARPACGSEFEAVSKAAAAA